MWENFVFLVIFDTCDVVYNLSISLLPSNVLDNQFGFNEENVPCGKGVRIELFFKLFSYDRVNNEKVEMMIWIL